MNIINKLVKDYLEYKGWHYGPIEKVYEADGVYLVDENSSGYKYGTTVVTQEELIGFLYTKLLVIEEYNYLNSNK